MFRLGQSWRGDRRRWRLLYQIQEASTIFLKKSSRFWHLSNKIGRYFFKFVTFSENMNKKTLPLGWDKVEEVIGGGGGCCIRCPEAGGCWWWPPWCLEDCELWDFGAGIEAGGLSMSKIDFGGFIEVTLRSPLEGGIGGGGGWAGLGGSPGGSGGPPGGNGGCWGCPEADTGGSCGCPGCCFTWPCFEFWDQDLWSWPEKKAKIIVFLKLIRLKRL